MLKEQHRVEKEDAVILRIWSCSGPTIPDHKEHQKSVFKYIYILKLNCFLYKLFLAFLWIRGR